MDDSSEGRAKPSGRNHAALLDTLVGKTISEALRIWIETDPQAAHSIREVPLPSEVPLGSAEIRQRAFAKRVDRNSVPRVPSGWDALELRSRPPVSGSLEPSAADVVIQDRIIEFMDFLRTGRLFATSLDGDIPVAVWQRSDAVLVVESSHLHLLLGGKRFCSVAILHVHQADDSAKGLAAVLAQLERDGLTPSDFNKHGSKRAWSRKHAAALGYPIETIEKYLRDALKALRAGDKPD